MRNFFLKKKRLTELHNKLVVSLVPWSLLGYPYNIIVNLITPQGKKKRNMLIFFQVGKLLWKSILHCSYFFRPQGSTVSKKLMQPVLFPASQPFTTHTPYCIRTPFGGKKMVSNPVPPIPLLLLSNPVLHTYPQGGYRGVLGLLYVLLRKPKGVKRW